MPGWFSPEAGLHRMGCFTGSGISLPSLRRRPGWARFAFKHQLVWMFAIALDLAVDLGLDLGKFFFDFDFTLGGDGHYRLPSCEGRANRIMPLDRFPNLSQGAIILPRGPLPQATQLNRRRIRVSTTERTIDVSLGK